MRTVKPQTRPFSPRLFLLNGKWAKLEHCSPPIDSPIIITRAGRSPRACLLDLQSSTSIGDKKELGHETNNLNFDNFAIPYFLCAEEADGTSTATHHAKPVSLPYIFPFPSSPKHTIVYLTNPTITQSPSLPTPYDSILMLINWSESQCCCISAFLCTIQMTHN